jgi:hypothetical protein
MKLSSETMFPNDPKKWWSDEQWVEWAKSFLPNSEIHRDFEGQSQESLGVLIEIANKVLERTSSGLPIPGPGKTYHG